MDILTALQELNACHAPSGEEKEIRDCIQRMTLDRVDETHVDALGNLILHKKGTGPKLLFAAHMDSIGLMVTHIEKEGFLRFGCIGGLPAENILYTPVRFLSGIRGTIVPDQAADRSKLTLDDLYVDIGAKDEQEAAEQVRIGDTAVYDTPLNLLGSRLLSPYLDNRISCLALLKAMESIDKSPNDLYFVFTVQEEPGLRGAKPAAFAIDPDYAVVCDVTPAGDQPGSKHYGSSRLGGGAAIKVMDTSVICHPEMVDRLKALAEKNGITAQNDVIVKGGTDAGPLHISRSGVLTGGVSVPCRYIHTPQEMADLRDVESCAALLSAFAESALPALR
ncbi:MAG: M42 family metallopeptidase [Bacillota bacterium]|jgi:endoglucanase|nr:M42 family metallopeptidase [Eubacteriales bacterium]MDI9492260.1 M42 family metallopeptidase [Bacillota bacterium]NLV69730.1 M42 family metallopeptidase [Clostridiales bacterium]HRV33783.1 M42 family metallopeptidase [Anaerovoracaceae bacterium]MDD4445033.1 M42 family metallopeptidase [Eubacteriales bacterium]